MSVWQITLNQQQDGVDMANVLHYETGSTVTGSDIQALVDEIRGVYVTHLSTELTDDWSLVSAAVRQVDINDQPTILYNFTAGVLVGSQTADPAPRNVAILLSKVANTPRPNRGRMYMVGFSDSQTQGSAVLPASLPSWQNFANAMIDIEAPEGVFWNLVIVRWGLLNSAISAWNPVQNFVARSTLATQRRRLRK